MLTAANNALPWRELMEASFGVMRLTPDVFWKMTPAEWKAAAAWLQEDIPITREEVQTLMECFPDTIVSQDSRRDP